MFAPANAPDNTRGTSTKGVSGPQRIRSLEIKADVPNDSPSTPSWGMRSVVHHP